MTKPRARPSDPMVIMQARQMAALDALERRGQAQEVASYIDRRQELDESITVTKDYRGHVLEAKRKGLFGMLMARGTITEKHHKAVNRLWDDVAISRHEADRSPLVAGTGGSGTHGPLDRALAAQDRCALVASHVGSRCWLVLRDLIANEICAAPEPWRSIVRMATGEEDETCQAMAVRWACGELVRAYHDIDNDAPMPRARARLAGGV